MIISLIAAMGRNRIIGNNNRLPWNLPADMKRFKALTKGKIVIMGRKTFESIGKPLPNRTNIVITKQEIEIPGCIVTGSADSAWLHALVGNLDNTPGEVMIMGGASIYKQFLGMADRIYLTIIDDDFEGDAIFPIFENPDVWEETEHIKHDPDEENLYPYTFLTFVRKNAKK